MKTFKNILLVRVPYDAGTNGRALRDYILESLPLGVLVLTDDTTLEVMELPELVGIEIEPETSSASELCSSPPNPIEAGVKTAVLSEKQKEAEEKREIIRRLKNYRTAHGPGCLAEVSARTARRKDHQISDDVLLNIAADGAPKMPIKEWRRISKALDQLEGEDSDPDRA